MSKSNSTMSSSSTLVTTGMGLISKEATNKRMTLYQEEMLLRKLARCRSALDVQKSPQPDLLSPQDALKARRLYRKLQVRKLQRSHGLTTWTMQEGVRPIKSDQDQQRDQDAQSRLSCSSFLVPKVKPEIFSSPYTGRKLKPFIRRDFDRVSIRVKMHRELLQKVNGSVPVANSPLDFCYIRPHHVPAVNRLAREHFWPGIDVSESLQHPDFSAVAVYRRMVVGFALMLPHASNTEAYVTFMFTHPEWRRLGLAKFFLYHLIQTCSGKDLVLHVSANNPAVVLYQNFGFKVEERIENFYDKYLPADSKQCKHALFLRLAR